MPENQESPNFNFDPRFVARDLSIKVFPEMDDEATMPIIAGKCTLGSLCHGGQVLSVIVTCGFIATCIRSHPCRVNHSCMDGSPSREQCDKHSQCNKKSDCGISICGHCTHEYTACHCTHNETVCVPGGAESCHKTDPWGTTDGNTCAEGDNKTHGCGCTNSDCSKPCTNEKSDYPVGPASPAEKSAASIGNAELVALLKADLIARLNESR